MNSRLVVIVALAVAAQRTVSAEQSPYGSRNSQKSQQLDVDDSSESKPQTEPQSVYQAQQSIEPQYQIQYVPQPSLAAQQYPAQQYPAQQYSAQQASSSGAAPQQQYQLAYIMPQQYTLPLDFGSTASQYSYLGANTPLIYYPQATQGASVSPQAQSSSTDYFKASPQIGDYFKVYQQQQLQSQQLNNKDKTAPSQVTKNLPTPQISSLGGIQYVPAFQQQLYQPLTYTAPQVPLQYYKFAQQYQPSAQQYQSSAQQYQSSPQQYQISQQYQTPLKSIYSSGVKSTTPSSPLKSSEQYIPINSALNSGYTFEIPTVHGERSKSVQKVRLS